MSHTKRLMVLAGAALGLVAPAMAQQELATRDEVRAIVAEMMADAQTRTSLLQGGGMAGYNDGFFLASADNKFRLNFSGYGQVRYTVNVRRNDAAPTGRTDPNSAGPEQNKFQGNFSLPRVRLQLDGHVISPDFLWTINGDFSSGRQTSTAIDTTTGNPVANQVIVNSGTGGSFSLKDAFFQYKFGGGWYVGGGQFKPWFLIEELIGDNRQQAVDRSVVNEAFTLGRSQGVFFGYETTDFRARVDFTDGARALNTEFASTRGGPEGNSADWAVGGRAEYNFGGKFSDFKDYGSSGENQEFTALLGAGFTYQGAPNTDQFGSDLTSNSDAEYLGYTADLTVKGYGFNAYAAFVGNYLRTKNSLNLDRHDFGLTVGAGYRIQDTELFARYEHLFIDNGAGTGRQPGGPSPVGPDNFPFLTVGVNQFFAGHAMKFTLDTVIAFSETDDLASVSIVPQGQNAGNAANIFTTNTGLLPSSRKAQFAVRGQFTFAF